jgi:hypothetical protein
MKRRVSINFQQIGAEKGKRNLVRRESCFTPEINGRLIRVNFIHKQVIVRSWPTIIKWLAIDGFSDNLDWINFRRVTV